MSLSAQEILQVQTVLKSEGLLYGAPSSQWIAAAVDGYKHYLIKIGVPFPNHTLMPGSFSDVPACLRAKVAALDSSEPTQATTPPSASVSALATPANTVRQQASAEPVPPVSPKPEITASKTVELKTPAGNTALRIKKKRF